MKPGLVAIVPDVYLYPGQPSEQLLAELTADPEWWVISAAKDPWFVAKQKELQDQPSLHISQDTYLKRYVPQYLIVDGRRVYLNMVDAFKKDQTDLVVMLIDSAVTFISQAQSDGQKVLVHCNTGVSRSPTVVLYWMMNSGLLPNDYDAALRAFMRMYKYYVPTAFGRYLSV